MKLIVLPGMDGTGILLEPFAREAEKLGSPCRILSYPTARFLSYEELLDEIVIPSLPEDDFAVVAESFSGPLGLALAQRALPNLRGLILVATFAEPPESLLLRLSSILPVGWILSMPIPCFMTHKMMLGSFNPAGPGTSICEVARLVTPDVIASRLEAVRKLKLEPGHIRVPGLYIRAGQDGLLPSTVIEGVRRLVPDLTEVVIRGPHLVLSTAPESCAAACANFIGGIDTAKNLQGSHRPVHTAASKRPGLEGPKR